jgi:hypothetical protein
MPNFSPTASQKLTKSRRGELDRIDRNTRQEVNGVTQTSLTESVGCF